MRLEGLGKLIKPYYLIGFSMKLPTGTVLFRVQPILLIFLPEIYGAQQKTLYH
jgi:hypothetical protein